MSFAVAASLFVLALVLLVVFTMAVENWSHLVQPLRLRARAADHEGVPSAAVDALTLDDPVHELDAVEVELATVEAELGALEVEIATTEAELETAEAELETVEAELETAEAELETAEAEPETSEAEPEPETAEVEPAAELVPPGSLPAGAVAVTDHAVLLRDARTADVTTGALFAAYAAARLPGADRVAAWVTAAAPPPSAEVERFPAGVQLRGKPARVAELLSHRDGGALWVTLNTSVDIARGLARTPANSDTMADLLLWWEHTRGLPAVLEAADVIRLRDAVATVRPLLDATAWGEPVRILLEGLEAAAADDQPLLIDSLGGASNLPDSDDGAKSTTARTAETSSGP